MEVAMNHPKLERFTVETHGLSSLNTSFLGTLPKSWVSGVVPNIFSKFPTHFDPKIEKMPDMFQQDTDTVPRTWALSTCHSASAQRG